jgi:hypothetical protein
MTQPGEAPKARLTYLVLDGENLDATLGSNVLGRRPAPDERPRWERVLAYCQSVWDQPVKALFFLNASSGTMPMSFVQALMAMGLRPVPLSGPPGHEGRRRRHPADARGDRRADADVCSAATTATSCRRSGRCWTVAALRCWASRSS